MPSFTLKDKYITKSSKNRLYKIDTPIIGLTGGIATGKSTASSILLELGHLVIDADKLVKSIYSSNESILFISEISPDCVKDNKIDFKYLRDIFFTNSIVKEKIEKYIYPKLREQFLKQIPSNNKKMIIYDAPILFERELDKLVDQSLVIYSPASLQVKRLTSRDSISEELSKKIISSQISIEEKKDKADFVIENTSHTKDLKIKLKNFIKEITNNNMTTN